MVDDRGQLKLRSTCWLVKCQGLMAENSVMSMYAKVLSEMLRMGAIGESEGAERGI